MVTNAIFWQRKADDQALAAVPAVLSGCLARRRLQLPSSRASQDLKKGCSDKLRFFLASSGPCRPDLKPRPIDTIVILRVSGNYVGVVLSFPSSGSDHHYTP